MRKKEIKFYSDEFKLEVIKDVLSGKYSKEEARIAYEIKGNSAILNWIRKFSMDSKRYKNESVNSKDNELMIQLSKEELRIKELEKALKKEKLRGELMEKIIDIAEEHFNIDIRKKYGAKQYTPSKRNKTK